MRGRATALALALGLTLAAPAAAEEGLFVARAGGGVATVHPEMPDTGAVIAVSADLCVSELTGVIGATTVVLHDRYDVLGLSLGVKRLVREREWTRFYLVAAPELTWIWDGEADGERHVDLALRGALGFEYLMLWGFGLVFELAGSLPAGLGEARPYHAASVGLTAGVFMEF